MKRFSYLKGFITGAIIFSIGIVGVFASGGIKLAEFNTNKVIFNGKELNLQNNQMISVVKEGETNAANYMPIKTILEQMGYYVNWDGNLKAAIISSNPINSTEAVGGNPVNLNGTITNTVPDNRPIEEINISDIAFSLPITTVEQGLLWKPHSSRYKINNNSELIMIDYYSNQEIIIDNNVRHFFAKEKLGFSSYFYIKNDNTLWAFGDNYYGTLGDGTGTDQENPVKIMDDVAIIGDYSEGELYAIKTDKTVWKWGTNTSSAHPAPIGASAFEAYSEVNYSPVLIANDTVMYFYSYFYKKGMFLSTTGFIRSGFTDNDIQLPSIDEPIYDIRVRINRQKSIEDINFINYYYINKNRDLILWDGAEKKLLAENVDRITSRNTFTDNIHFIKRDNTLWGFGANGNGELGDGTKVPKLDNPVKIADNILNADEYVYMNTNHEVWFWDSSNPTPFKSKDNVDAIGFSPYPYSPSYSSFAGDDQEYIYMVMNGGEMFIAPVYTYGKNSYEESEFLRVDDVKIPKSVTFP